MSYLIILPSTNMNWPWAKNIRENEYMAFLNNYQYVWPFILHLNYPRDIYCLSYFVPIILVLYDTCHIKHNMNNIIIWEEEWRLRINEVEAILQGEICWKPEICMDQVDSVLRVISLCVFYQTTLSLLLLLPSKCKIRNERSPNF